MGAVQSGKTASMMAVTALALDKGVDLVVILAGTRRSLWLQTLERFTAQVDSHPDKLRRRTLMPLPALINDTESMPGPADLYTLPRPAMRQSIAARRPVIAVTMKNTAHLERLSKLMSRVVGPEVAAAGRPFHMLVIDDEADDSSINNLIDVPGGDAATVETKQIPRRILDLWQSRKQNDQTLDENLYATYMAYTATPQANFLQEQDNALAPRDFIVALRTPGSQGLLDVRTSTYKAPEGVNAWYTGGDMFYRMLDQVPLCVASTDSDEELIDGVRAFLVASAIRRMRTPERISPAEAKRASFASLEAAKRELPAVVSMLVNPSSGLGDHFDVAGQIHAWSMAMDAEEAKMPLWERPSRGLGVDGIRADMAKNAARWIHWLENYRRSANVVAALPGAGDRNVPTGEQWPAVSKVITEEIVPATSVAVINSDDNADERPKFTPESIDGEWRAPANLSTIFVSGNVMSRGLTLEGLLTTVFTRSAEHPLADTQMQMQRWFGYRGAYLDLCRVFMREAQIDLFSHFHDNDELLRKDILAAMEGGGVSDPLILQGRNFLATGKIANTRGVSLSPGNRHLFPLLNMPPDDEGNRAVVAGLLREPGTMVGPRDHPRGYLCSRALSLGETADLLDQLRFTEHGADRAGVEASRWQSAARAAGLNSTTPELYRAPTVDGPSFQTNASPYTVAAYLRFWEEVLNRKVPGLYTTDLRTLKWGTLDASARSLRTARFNVAVRFGPGEPVTTGTLGGLPVSVGTMARTVHADRTIDPAWGSQNGPTRGDDFFDYEALGQQPRAAADRTRLVGENGLILFHVIDRSPDEPTIAVGYSIPRGGPDFVQATRGASHG
ncbi:Z1 domain-containing protein [Demequina sediminicola]|uniref:Z1 domain-containing protein n=1 Tax=Demequina sediminicola TaxID=1095026 RepID=UPI00128C2DF2|nr:Z1 domain-containing protein [Demequina sediminicola]